MQTDIENVQRRFEIQFRSRLGRGDIPNLLFVVAYVCGDIQHPFRNIVNGFWQEDFVAVAMLRCGRCPVRIHTAQLVEWWKCSQN